MKTIFENDVIKVSKTGRDYDFIAVVENETNKEIEIVFDNDEMKIQGFAIKPNDWVGLLADEEGYLSLEEITAKRFVII